MDAVDLRILNMLRRNPRMTLREMGGELNISTPAVHKRMRAIKQSGVLGGTYSCISPSYLQAVQVIVLGHTRLAGLDSLAKALSSDGRTYQVSIMGSMKALARGILDGTGELDDYARKVMGSSQMDGAKVLVISEAHKAQRESGTLTRLDLRIIGALREDGRKPLAIVAKEVDATAKTVRRRVGRLRDLGMVAFDVIEDTNASSGAIAAVIETYLDGSVDREEIAKDISQNHGISSSGLLRFSNDQSFMLCLTWVNSIGELDRLCQAIAANKGVSKAVPNVVLGSRSFDTWFDRLLEDAGSAERALASKNLI